jgi:hypothetical protein
MDEFVLPRLRRLTQCPTADGAVGKLNIVLSVDFDGNKVIPSIGRGTTVENPDTFLGCTQSAFQMPNLAGIEHAHPRYTVAYGLDFSAPPGTNANPGIGAAATAGTRLPGRTLAGAKESVAGTGTFVQGQVMWEVAIVRDTPRTGQVVGRVHRGMNVQVGRAQDGWYRIKFGPDFSSEGWIYRGAIGR